MMFLPALKAHQPRNVTLNGSIPYDSLQMCRVVQFTFNQGHEDIKAVPPARSESACILKQLLWGGNISIKSGQRKKMAGRAHQTMWWAQLFPPSPPPPALIVSLSRNGHYMEIFKMRKKLLKCLFSKIQRQKKKICKSLRSSRPKLFESLNPSWELQRNEKKRRKEEKGSHWSTHSPWDGKMYKTPHITNQWVNNQLPLMILGSASNRVYTVRK